MKSTYKCLSLYHISLFYFYTSLIFAKFGRCMRKAVKIIEMEEAHACEKEIKVMRKLA